MSHLVLLGDSVFDNASYVPGQLPVIEQVRNALPRQWQATLLAIDGDVVNGVADQLSRLPTDATHLAVSVGGNDALRHSAILHQPAKSVAEVMRQFVTIQDEFRRDYRTMLAAVTARQLPRLVCTIYDTIPGLSSEAACALSVFNDVIVREAARLRVSILDLRLICDRAEHYSSLSPIEPSAAGGQRIAEALARVAVDENFGSGSCLIFAEA
jgi:lysophospholipase L1-like esterase